MIRMMYSRFVVITGYTLFLVLTPASALDDSKGAISGTVVNAATGEPLRKAYVRLSPASDAGHVHPTVTDEAGRYALKNLPPGSYSLEAEHQGFLDSGYGVADSPPVELKLLANQELSGIDVKLIAPAAISGRVTDEDGDAWNHAVVNVFRSRWVRGRWQLEGFTSADVDDNGAFRVGHLPPGRYFLLAEPDANWEATNRSASSPRLQPTWYPSSFDSSDATSVVLTAGQEFTGFLIRLRPSSVHRITGTVSGLQQLRLLQDQGRWGRPRLSLSPMRGAGASSKSGFLQKDGAFQVEGVASGNYRLRVEQGLLPAMVLGSVEVQVGDHDVEGVSIQVRAPHSLKGTISLDGKDTVLPKRLSLWLDSSEDVAWEATVVPGEDGSFQFENVPYGRHRVFVPGEPFSSYYVTKIRYGGIYSSDSTFTLSEVEDTLEVTLSSQGAKVNGVVKGNPSADAAPMIVVLLPDPIDSEPQLYKTRHSEIYRGVLDQSNAFTVKDVVRPGSYTAYAFQGVPDGVWTDRDFMKGVTGKGVPIKVEKGDVKTIEVSVIPRSDIESLLTRLGMN